jgi:hypothetical protein
MVWYWAIALKPKLNSPIVPSSFFIVQKKWAEAHFH